MECYSSNPSNKHDRPIVPSCLAEGVKKEQKRINVDFPAWVVESLDREAARIGVTRQSIIKVWLVERLKAESANKPSMVRWPVAQISSV